MKKGNIILSENRKYDKGPLSGGCSVPRGGAAAVPLKIITDTISAKSPFTQLRPLIQRPLAKLEQDCGDPGANTLNAQEIRIRGHPAIIASEELLRGVMMCLCGCMCMWICVSGCYQRMTKSYKVRHEVRTKQPLYPLIICIGEELVLG